jgi:hypothetical protein
VASFFKKEIMPEKQYTIIKTRTGGRTGNDDTREITGTLAYLIQYFSYTLEVGASYNHKINRQPKTIKSFISNLEKALDEKEGACYNRTLISLKPTTNTFLPADKTCIDI